MDHLDVPCSTVDVGHLFGLCNDKPQSSIQRQIGDSYLDNIDGVNHSDSYDSGSSSHTHLCEETGRSSGRGSHEGSVFVQAHLVVVVVVVVVDVGMREGSVGRQLCVDAEIPSLAYTEGR